MESSDLEDIIEQATCISLDSETTGLHFWQDRLKLVTLATDQGYSVAFTEDNWAELAYLLPIIYTKRVIAANWMFDSLFLHKAFPEAGWPIRVWDVQTCESMLTSGLRDEHHLPQRVGLAPTLARRYGIPLDKQYQTYFVEHPDVLPADIPDEVIEYALEDVRHLHRLMQDQAEEIILEEQQTVWALECAALPTFAKMKYHGIAIDKPRFEKLFDNDDPAQLGVKQQEALVEAELVELLTPHVNWLRIERFDAEVEALGSYLRAEAEEVWAYKCAWLEDPHDDSMPEEWRDKSPHADGEAWLSKGQKRMVDYYLKDWRANHKRPAKPHLDESPINLASPLQVNAALEDLGVKLKNTRKNTLKAALPGMNSEARQVVVTMLKWRGLNKRRTTFGEPLLRFLDEDNVLHGNIKPNAARTGRPTCDMPNLLAQPKTAEYRDCFIARPGKKIVRYDYSQMELRITAELSGDEAMLYAFDHGIDIHTQTAAQIHEIPIEGIADDSPERKIAKVYGFGLLYGMGVETLYATMLAQGIDTTLENVQQKYNKWKETFHGAARLLDRQGRQAVSRGYTQTILGRRQRFPIPANAPGHVIGKARRVGANHVIQGSNADITKLAMVLAQPRLETLGGSILLQIYDEIVAEVPEEHAQEGARELRAAMLGAARALLRVTPVAVDGGVSSSWAGLDTQ